MNQPLTWAEIDLGAYAHNIKELRRITDPTASLMAVVKANGYGHGAAEVAREALQNGANCLGVARIEEAIQLRQAGIEAPILIFGYSSPGFVEKIIDYDFTQAVYSTATARALSEQAARKGKKIKIHIKVDSGMGRLGLLMNGLSDSSSEDESAQNPVGEVEVITRLSGLRVEGVFTHFATADIADDPYASRQLERFLDFIDQLGRSGLEPPLKHAANSGALINLPESHLDMVRPGIATYGLHPAGETGTGNLDLKPVMTLKTKIIHLKKVPAGFNISYGITYKTKNSTTIATIPIGYADGFNRLLSSRGHMLVNGKKVPIVGRVCMDLTMVDVGKLSEIAIEDEVVVVGSQAKESITADELAANLNTINYEIVTSITSRVPRIYLK